MKTTIDIADSILREAKKIAGREKTTLRSLVEEGLREILPKHKKKPDFKIKKASFKGSGLQEEFSDEGWQKIRSVIYERQGG